MAKAIAFYEPQSIILAVSHNQTEAQQCILYNGIVPVFTSKIFSITTDSYFVMYIIIILY